MLPAMIAKGYNGLVIYSEAPDTTSFIGDIILLASVSGAILPPSILTVTSLKIYFCSFKPSINLCLKNATLFDIFGTI